MKRKRRLPKKKPYNVVGMTGLRALFEKAVADGKMHKSGRYLINYENLKHQLFPKTIPKPRKRHD